MKKLLVILTLSLTTSLSFSQTVGSSAAVSTHVDSGANANTGAITFEASQQVSRLSTTPSVYTAPATFGGSNNCGTSDSLGVGITGFGIGGSRSKESDSCNDREDTAVAFKLGRKDVAEMRFFCFGSEKNKMAWEAVGNTCPLPKVTAIIIER